MRIEALTWDSDFFGFPVGRLTLDADHDWQAAQRLLQVSEYQLVYVHTDAQNSALLAEITTKAPLYDLKTYFVKKKLDKTKWPIGIKRYTGSLYPELLLLALQSGVYSRFNKDPKLKPFFTKLYTLWIENSLSGSMAEAIFIHKTAQHTNGFVTVSTHSGIGQIGLIAVSPESRGQGIASMLLQATETWYNKQQCNQAIVVTQGENLPACNLYKKNGYHIDERIAICHWWR